MLHYGVLQWQYFFQNRFPVKQLLNIYGALSHIPVVDVAEGDVRQIEPPFFHHIILEGGIPNIDIMDAGRTLHFYGMPSVVLVNQDIDEAE